MKKRNIHDTPVLNVRAHLSRLSRAVGWHAGGCGLVISRLLVEHFSPPTRLANELGALRTSRSGLNTTQCGRVENVILHSLGLRWGSGGISKWTSTFHLLAVAKSSADTSI